MILMSIKTLIKEHISDSPLIDLGELKDHLHHDNLKNHFTENSLKNYFPNNILKEHWSYIIYDKFENDNSSLIYNDGKLCIREFKKADLDDITSLFIKVFSSYPWYDNWSSFNQVQHYIQELIENPVFKGFVAFEDKKLAAVCLGHRRSFWMGKELFVDEFFVENERQGNGIGSKILEIITDNLVQEGYSRLTLLTNKGIPAEYFYFKNGFNNNLKRTVMVKEI